MVWPPYPTKSHSCKHNGKNLSHFNSFSWVKGKYGCDLGKVETMHQKKTIILLPNSLISIVIFFYFLDLLCLSFISLFSLLSPEISITSFPSIIVYFQVACHFQLIKLTHAILNLNMQLSSSFTIAMKTFSLLILQFPIPKCWVLVLCWFGHLHIQQCPTMPNRGPAMLGFVGRNITLIWLKPCSHYTN